MKGAIAAYVDGRPHPPRRGDHAPGRSASWPRSCGEESGRRDIGCNTVLERGHRADLAIFPEPSNFAHLPHGQGRALFQADRAREIDPHLQPPPRRPAAAARRRAAGRQRDRQHAQVPARDPRAGEAVEPLAHQPARRRRAACSSTSTPCRPAPRSPRCPTRAEATGSLLFNPDLTGDEVMAEIRATHRPGDRRRLLAARAPARARPAARRRQRRPLDQGAGQSPPRPPRRSASIQDAMRDRHRARPPPVDDLALRLRRQLLVPARPALPRSSASATRAGASTAPTSSSPSPT